jgi:chromosome partitioning protein
MAEVICVANHKGGVGKTTIVVNLAAELSKNKKVLVIDSDPQANATTHLGVAKRSQPFTLRELLAGESWERCCLPIQDKLHLIPSHARLYEYDIRGHKALSQKIKPYLDNYDYVFIDCAPSMSLLTVNAFAASEHLIVPIENGFLALEGLDDLLQTIDTFQERFSFSVNLLAIVLNMVDWRQRLSREVFEQLKTHFPTQLAQTAIPRNVRLAEAPSHGVPINQYNPFCQGAVAFRDLAKEITKLIEKNKKQLKKQKKEISEETSVK